MSALKRNNVLVRGKGSMPMMFAHGYGCDQNMWRFVAPAFEASYQTILFDHVGMGCSDLTAYSREKYDTLEGYAEDIIEIAGELQLKDAVFVGHSVSAMMGIMAAAKAPGLFKALVLVGPSPSYINEGNYIGGFTKTQIEEFLESLDNNHMGWSMTMTPIKVECPDCKKPGQKLTSRFCHTDPEIARHFARTTFLSDCRDILADVAIPTLILQCSNDAIAPQVVGEYVHHQMPDSRLILMEATGHYPNLSAPEETIAAIKTFL